MPARVQGFDRWACASSENVLRKPRHVLEEDASEAQGAVTPGKATAQGTEHIADSLCCLEAVGGTRRT